MALSLCVQHYIYTFWLVHLNLARTHTSVHEGQGRSAKSGKEKSTLGSGTVERGSRTCQVGFLFLINMGWLSLFLKCELFLKRCQNQVGFLFHVNMGWLSLFLDCELFLKRCQNQVGFLFE